jgi:hypothetical protein
VDGLKEATGLVYQVVADIMNNATTARLGGKARRQENNIHNRRKITTATVCGISIYLYGLII